MKKILLLALGLLLLAGCSDEQAGEQKLGGEVYDVANLINSSGSLTSPIASTTGTFSSTLTVTGAFTANGDATLGGTTPALTMGDAGEEDAQINFDGNALDFHIGLDDSADTLIIGKGTALGTTPAITINTNQLTTLAAGLTVTTGDVTNTAGDNILTDGRILGGVEGTPTNCAANAVTIPLATDRKTVVVADQSTAAACAVTLSGGTAGEIVVLDLIYGGDVAWTFAAGTQYIGDTFTEANCNDFQSTAADGDHLFVTGVMIDADTIAPISCQYLNAS